ncbi:MAG: hypothetical protein ACYSSI_07950 [Planctomycetota bacterium]|jgi:hypothetical protein
MSTGKFDKILREALHQHTESAPPDFTEMVLKQIKKSEDQRILERVILQERLALAGCITLSIAIIAMTVFLANTNAGLTVQVQDTINRITQTTKTFFYQWQLNFFVIGLMGFTIYAIVDFLVSDT